MDVYISFYQFRNKIQRETKLAQYHFFETKKNEENKNSLRKLRYS